MVKRTLDLGGLVAALAIALFSAGRPHGRFLLLLAACVGAVALIRSVAGGRASVRAPRAARRLHPPTDLGGMTVNERLACTGLLQDWDAAFSARDRAKLIEIATCIEIADPVFTVDTTLADPAKYGRR